MDKEQRHDAAAEYSMRASDPRVSLKQCWQERLDGQECKANDSGDRMRTFEDGFTGGEESGDPAGGAEGEEEEHAAEELGVEVLGLGLLFRVIGQFDPEAQI